MLVHAGTVPGVPRRRRGRYGPLLPSATPLVLLHGFAGTPQHWRRVIAELPSARFGSVPLDVCGAEPLTPAGVTAAVAAAVCGRFVLAGYSMGARLALHTALAMPERLERLVLVSGTAGIEDARERAARRAADEELAEELDRGGLEEFIARWAALPLFAGDPQWVRDEVAREQRGCEAGALAACLRGLGPAAMAPMWDRLPELAIEVTVLAGERDSRYVALARRLVAALPRAQLTVVAGAGHRLALEAPGAIAAAIAG